MKTLTSKILTVNELSSETVTDMFELYNFYYAATNLTIFCDDLNNKKWVILLYDETQQLKGFSTLTLFESHYAGKLQRILYSGDTIVDHQFWGQHELAIAWIRFAGEIKAEAPATPLYWLLIVKGHRTYRYLSAFCHAYYPAHDQPIPSYIQGLMHQLANERFGVAYNKSKGLVNFLESHGHLREAWAEIPANVKKRAEVQYFLQRNPSYAEGDELVCLCELSQENLKPHAKRIFLAGETKKTRECA
jgi:hypothetical protein